MGPDAEGNPCRGVRKNKERPREFYADREVWEAVYAVAPPELRDAMDLNYLSGQRPADVLKMGKSHIKDDVLEVRQGKTRKMLRIVLERNGVRSELGQAIDRMIARPRTLQTDFLVATSDGQPLKSLVSQNAF